MSKFYAKYRFNSKEQFEEKKASFFDVEEGEVAPTHHIVGKGYSPETTIEIDEEGNEVLVITTEDVEVDGVMVTKQVDTEYYMADVIWRNLEVDEETGKGKHPYGWKTYHVKPKSPLLKPLWGFTYIDNME